MKEKIFWAMIAIISISFVINTLYAESKRLTEPVFLNHYIETTAQDEMFITFYYITNRDDPSTVSHVDMDGVNSYTINDYDFFAFQDVNQSIYNVQTFTHYALRSFRVGIDSFIFEDAFVDGVYKFTDMTVHFNDRTDVTTSIGEVIINEYEDNKVHDDLLTTFSQVESGDDGVIYSFSAKEEATYEDVEIPFGDIFRDLLQISLNTESSFPNTYIYEEESNFTGTDLKDIEFPFTLEEKYLQIEIKLSQEFIGVIDFPITFSGMTDSGKKFTSAFQANNQGYYLDKEKLKRLLSDQGEGGSQ